MIYLGIDPGQHESAYVLWDSFDKKIIEMDIVPNSRILYILSTCGYNFCGIETVVCYGQRVGKSVFETCFWIGEFRNTLKIKHRQYKLIGKPDIRLHFCLSRTANDAAIRRVLLDRFGEKGTKKNPGILYGVKTHIWSALAIVIYIADNESVLFSNS